MKFACEKQEPSFLLIMSGEKLFWLHLSLAEIQVFIPFHKLSKQTTLFNNNKFALFADWPAPIAKMLNGDNSY